MTREEQIAMVQRAQQDYKWHIQNVQGNPYLMPKQELICDLLSKHERVAAKACHGVGKTFIAARIVLAFLSSFPYSKVITTAPTSRLVKELLWAEIGAGYASSKYPLGGEMLTQQWKMDANWFALGFSPQKGASEGPTPTNFQGFHAPYVLIIFDEATGIPPSLWQQVEGMLTNQYVRFLAIGNPTTPACDFANCFTSRLWRCITISCFDSPNLIANGFLTEPDLVKEYDLLMSTTPDEQDARMNSYKVVRPEIVTAKWVMQRALEWGISHPLFRSKVIAEFPQEGDDILMSLGLVQGAQQREATETRIVRRSIGIDPARYGPDSTVITVMENDRQTYRKSMQGKNTMEVAGFVTQLVGNLPPVEEEVVITDAGGLGGGVADMLKENFQAKRLRATPIEINFGERAYLDWEHPSAKKRSHEKYFNMKARIFAELARELSKVSILDHQNYTVELPTIRYEFDSKGRLKIESKDEYKARTGRKSPDDSDSLAISNFGRLIPMPAANIPRIWQA